MSAKQTTKTTYQIPIGPIHPALKEPVAFEFEISDASSSVCTDV
jgi:Ni,Fe-hydrogenase III large subunit